ncbi:ATP-dependent RNA helicase DDX24 isoform X1 [Mustela erminea]|uniref:ATP-dependent RNA helicase DDX24 isoform X1 n=2 Tax=Mustela erminea TaxID=36723 RepID=UPI0013865F3B|nr:ATP-dependent RNA helicase DDX24 isoform X1 [Mustela erminea]XP_032201020.1 ATP-dependent RNA helicase DDX24 isoform X1 [Mustela erminea]XP_032201021.1 ATP-dependent RNA helicase DDX24 isoform X1 [Mustela erminea]XP_032201022.1 ATP-dependent RNA helicase DDX24 isoform X1 [Mustela erminea]
MGAGLPISGARACVNASPAPELRSTLRLRDFGGGVRGGWPACEGAVTASPCATMKLQETKSKPKAPSFGRFQTKGIKVVGKWKQVEIDPNMFADGQMDDLVCFEELTDYQLVSPAKNSSSLFSKEEPKKRKAQSVSGKEEGESSSSKKRMKLKKNKDMETEGISAQEEFEVKDAEPEPQGDGTVCPNPQVEEMVSESSAQTVPKKKKKKGKKKLEPSQGTTPKVPKKAKTWVPEMHDQKADVTAWKDLFVPKPVLRALSFLGFSAPTPIQALTLAPAIRDKLDILGAAETGSGKTLAFAIPMIHAVLQWQMKKKPTPAPSDTGAVSGETRTEATTESGVLPDEIGVKGEVLPSEAGVKATAPPSKVKSGAAVPDQVLPFCDGDAGEGPSSLVREKAIPKQDEDKEEKLDEEETGRLKQELDGKIATCKAHPKRPLLGLVLTPTRELAVQVKQHIDAVAKFTGIKTAILVGGMSAQKQQRMLNRQPEIVVATPGRLWELIKEKHPHLSNLRQLRCLVVDEADRMVEKGHFAELSQLLEMLSDSQYNPKRQTLIFSATLTLVHQAPARILHKKHIKKIDKTAKLDLLVQKIGMRGKPKVIDLTRNEATVETLTETKIHCETDEKDLYLYYFLMQYPGRTLVFANSISCIKRLSGLLKVLDIMPLTLHACMHQKQRLRNLEQFARLEDCVLLATDVAARGLDIPKVQHVIHYQVPRTSEIYVHRSGRTARATNEGLSLMLIGPEDVINFKKIYKTLKKDEDIPLFPVQTKYMDAVKERIHLARQIEKAEYRNFQACLHNSWIEQAAAALEIELEEEMYKGRKSDQQEERRRQKQMKVLKKELRHLLSQPLFKEDLKTKYPTQSGKLPTLMATPRNGESALSCLAKQKKKKKKKPPPKEQQQEQPQPSTSAD